jgi:hypothetical protein
LKTIRDFGKRTKKKKNYGPKLCKNGRSGGFDYVWFDCDLGFLF